MRSVSRSAFDDAAHAAGFELDAPQQRGALALSEGGRGVYLWGPVGRGKTWLMQTYFEALPTDLKLRTHFHEFFRDLHRALHRTGHNMNNAIASVLGGAEVVCFDEFHVHDIADALLVRQVMTTLLNWNIRVILTSNYRPEGLLPNPLVHERFVPTIDLLLRSLTIVEIDGPRDYRSLTDHSAGFAAGQWIVTADGAPVDPPSPAESRKLRPAGHPIASARVESDRVWFRFSDLCQQPTAASDYLALTQQYSRWIIYEIRSEGLAEPEAAQRFANVIDVLYDHDVVTTFIADSPRHHVLADPSRPADRSRIASRLGMLGAGLDLTRG